MGYTHHTPGPGVICQLKRNVIVVFVIVVVFMGFFFFGLIGLWLVCFDSLSFFGENIKRCVCGLGDEEGLGED